MGRGPICGRAFALSFPLTLPFALALLVFLALDVWKALWFETPTGGRELGLSVGTLVLALNVTLLGLYTFGCHSLRHLAGGMVDRLARDTCTRRANAITWNVALDPPTDDPPCLQRLWGRIITTEQGELVFNFNTHWRSRDAYKAAFMNMFAFTDLQRAMAAALSEKIGKQVAVGRYCDISDSFHIYGSYFSEFEGFLQLIEKRSFEDRTWNTEFAEPFFEEARQRIAAEGK